MDYENAIFILQQFDDDKVSSEPFMKKARCFTFAQLNTSQFQLYCTYSSYNSFNFLFMCPNVAIKQKDSSLASLHSLMAMSFELRRDRRLSLKMSV